MSKKLRPFTCHGVVFTQKAGNQRVGRCPFCGKREHFYVSIITGMWDCKKCGATGNVYTFLKKYSDMIYEETSIAEFRGLAKHRGLSVQALRNWKLGWDGEQWLFPVLSERKTCRDIRRWNPKQQKVVKATTGCKVQLYGWYKAASADTVWLCEGEWDTIALTWALDQCNVKKERVTGAPGAMTFKDEWVEGFKKKVVYLCYDNDIAGEQGTLKVYEALKGVAAEIKILKWPSSKPTGYDIRDFVRQGVNPKRILHQLRFFLTGPEKHVLLRQKEKVETTLVHPPSFHQVLEVCQKKGRSMNPDLVNALKIICAVVLSIQLEGEPLWVYIVGPAGSGKTMLLRALENNTKCEFQSTITARTLVSGFGRNTDPSLLPKLNNKCCVWKDFTEVLSIRPDDKNTIYSTLRGAYDGHVKKIYGNGIIREYHNLRFSMLAGVTTAIHGDKQDMLGERFLKFEISKQSGQSLNEQIRAAMRQDGKEKEVHKEIQVVINHFLRRRVYIPQIPLWVEKRIAALSRLISKIRAVSEREPFGDRVLRYKPTSEIGTRPAIQLQKLARALAIVDGVKCVTYAQYKLVEKVAFDSSDKMHLEIINAIKALGKEATVSNITEKVGLARSSTKRQLDDMYLVKAVDKYAKKERRIGRKTMVWKLSDETCELQENAKIGQKPKFK